MINRVKGTYDVLPSEIKKWHYLESKISEITSKYHYTEIRTPIMEYSGVFHRESELSDMVTKETYNFKDKGNRDVTLRPEGTAGIIRSYVENKLYADNDLTKVYYLGPNFRYERPQKGRYRQFSQFGLEAIGTKSALLDAEVISLASEFIKSLGLKNVVVEINSIGDFESRSKYQKALVTYLTPFADKLSFDSKERLQKNPLRILDSKDPIDQELLVNAPKPIDYLNIESQEYFGDLKKYLECFKVEYKINDKLVRGLDYYSDTVFEVKANIKDFGAQNVLGGGGRYNDLVKELGGPDISAIGIAFGMERLLYALESENLFPEELISLDSYIITLSNDEKKYGTMVLQCLREAHFNVDIDFMNKSFKGQLKKALKENSKTLIIIGEEELKKNVVQLKNTKTEEQQEVNIKNLKEILKKVLEN